MNTREIAVEYRLSHWAQIVQDRCDSGLSIKEYCENAGIHENAYYYWLKKLRGAACEGLMRTQSGSTSMVPSGFAEVKLPIPSAMPPLSGTCHSQVSIETAGLRITADGEYPVSKLAELLREVTR